MLRRVLLVLAGVAASALLAPTRAAEDDLSGNWQLSTVGLNGESTVCILKIETKDGKPTASILFAPENIETKVADFRVTESRVLVTVRQSRMIGKQTVTSEVGFVGVRGNDAKVISGSVGTATARVRAKLTATNKETLGKDELTREVGGSRTDGEGDPTQQQDVPSSEQGSGREGRGEAKGPGEGSQRRAKEADEKIPDLFREVADKHPDTPSAFDAATNLLRMSVRLKLTADEATKLVKLVQKQAAPYGPLFGGVALAAAAETLAGQPGLEAVALAAIEPAAKALSKDDPTFPRLTVLTAYQTALDKSGKGDAAKAPGEGRSTPST